MLKHGAFLESTTTEAVFPYTGGSCIHHVCSVQAQGKPGVWEGRKGCSKQSAQKWLHSLRIQTHGQAALEFPCSRCSIQLLKNTLVKISSTCDVKAVEHLICCGACEVTEHLLDS
eukprot:556625-Pelagomonas_calceolata.AAC.3